MGLSTSLQPRHGSPNISTSLPSSRTASKHDDQVDSTAQFLDWFRRPCPVQTLIETMQMVKRLRKGENPGGFRVRLQAPAGLGAVQTFSGRHINVGLDGTIEMSAVDAEYYMRQGWPKLAEWTIDDPV